jgi:hypothetical protein
MALFGARGASCDRGFNKGQEGAVAAINLPQEAHNPEALDGLVRQKSISDDQSHHARENQ